MNAAKCICVGPCCCEAFPEGSRRRKSSVYKPEAPSVPLKKSMSFLTTQELFSYKAIPAIGVISYLASSVGTIANHETFVQWVYNLHTYLTLAVSG